MIQQNIQLSFCFNMKIERKINCQSFQKVQARGHPHLLQGLNQSQLLICLLRFPKSAFQIHLQSQILLSLACMSSLLHEKNLGLLFLYAVWRLPDSLVGVQTFIRRKTTTLHISNYEAETLSSYLEKSVSIMVSWIVYFKASSLAAAVFKMPCITIKNGSETSWKKMSSTATKKQLFGGVCSQLSPPK